MWYEMTRHYHCWAILTVCFCVCIKGGRTDIADLNGYSPLLWACACGHLDIARQLLELANRDLLSLEGTEIQDENGLSSHREGGTSPGSPLHVASLVGALDVCLLLIKNSTTVSQN